MLMHCRLKRCNLASARPDLETQELVETAPFDPFALLGGAPKRMEVPCCWHLHCHPGHVFAVLSAAADA
jgi:hypothetical protein